MAAETPRLEIYTDRIAQNAEAVVRQCAEHGVGVAAVTKVLQAHPAVLEAFKGSGATMLADSRLGNLRRIVEAGIGLPTMLLRAPTPADAEAVVQLADYSLNSSVETVVALSGAALAAGLRHKVIMMVDLGDLREGIWPDHAVEKVVQVSNLAGIEVAGIGANFACYGGVLPTVQKLEMLIGVRDECRAATGLPLELISGGNSANLPLLATGGMPTGINQLRIGEAIILGRNTLDRSAWPGTRQDTVELVAGVIELERKPSVPIGDSGQNAFGEEAQFVDRGVRLRAICNIGRQDVLLDGLIPNDPGIIILGASSDHLILDVSDAEQPLGVGSEIRFSVTYGGLLAASTSGHVNKMMIGGV